MPRLLLDVWTFLEVGGPVLVLIFASTTVMWTVILERFWFLERIHPSQVEAIVRAWAARSDRSSWSARQIRRMWISQSVQRLERSLPLLRGLVAVSPLLGLLGTVTGMIEVYEVMAIAGNGNARAMAGGVSRAMVTTMAGLVAALSGILLTTRLEQRAHEEHEQLQSWLHLDDESNRPNDAETGANHPGDRDPSSAHRTQAAVRFR